MTDPATDHTAHDPLLISAWVAAGAAPSDAQRAASLAASCGQCRVLAEDLRALAAAVHDLPAPRRPRDFVLRPEDAKRARRRGWRRLLAAFGGPRFDVVRPLAAGLTTLGIAGFLLGSIPSLGGMAAAPAGADQEQLTVDRTYDNQAPGAMSGGGDSSHAPGEGAPAVVDVSGEDGRDAPAGEGPQGVRDARAASPLAVLSGSFLIVGLGLFGLRWSARRLGDG